MGTDTTTLRHWYLHKPGFRNPPDGNRGIVKVREQTLDLERKSTPLDDPFAYFAAVVRGEVRVADRERRLAVIPYEAAV